MGSAVQPLAPDSDGMTLALVATAFGLLLCHLIDSDFEIWR